VLNKVYTVRTLLLSSLGWPQWFCCLPLIDIKNTASALASPELRKPQLLGQSSRLSALVCQASRLHMLFYGNADAVSAHSSMFSSFTLLPIQKQIVAYYLSTCVLQSVCVHTMDFVSAHKQIN